MIVSAVADFRERCFSLVETVFQMSMQLQKDVLKMYGVLL